MNDNLDLIMYYFKDAFHVLQVTVKDSVLEYFNKAKVTYIIIATMLMIVTAFLALTLGICIYKKVKTRILQI